MPNYCSVMRKFSLYNKLLKKMELAHRLTQTTFSKRFLSRNLMLKQYSTVIRPEAQYALEYLS